MGRSWKSFGDNAHYIYYEHINCSNICRFCAFGCQEDSDLAYEMDVEEVQQEGAIIIDLSKVIDNGTQVETGGNYPNILENRYSFVI